LERAERALGVKLNVDGFERKPDQVYRYMTGKDGSTATGVGMFAPGTCLLLCERLQEQFERVWVAASGAVPTS
jgi:hypothetical protein